MKDYYHVNYCTKKKFYFQYIIKKIMATCNFFDKEQWAIYFTLLAPYKKTNIWLNYAWKDALFDFFNLKMSLVVTGSSFCIGKKEEEMGTWCLVESSL